MKYTRNEFLKLSGLSITGTLAAKASSGLSGPLNADAKDMKFGVASYTFRKFNIDDTIKMTQRLGLKSIALKAMHMPLESSVFDIQQIAAKVRGAGLDLYGGGVIYMKTQKEVESAFKYAAAAGFNMIIGVPNHELLPFVNEQVKSSGIRLAIHNHGPGDKLYTSPDDVYEKVKNLDPRMGLCIDIGHVQRISQDPASKLEKYKDRLFDIHLKDVNKTAEDGTPVEIGRGVIDIPRVLKTLLKIKYKGYVGFEYEKDENDPLPGLAESVGYIRGVLKMI